MPVASGSQETIDRLRKVTADFAAERVFSHAIAVLRGMEETDFLHIADEYFAWPFSTPQSDCSFADELFWAYKYDIPLSIEPIFEEEVRVACKRMFDQMTCAEQAFLVEALPPRGSRDGDERVIHRLLKRVLEIVRDYDKEILSE
jgi:hypothetical protein